MQGTTLVSVSLIFFLVISSCNGLVAPGNRVQSRRWNGGYKTASKSLADIPKKNKMKLDLIANGITKTVEKKRQETLQHVLSKGESALRVCACTIRKVCLFF